MKWKMHDAASDDETVREIKSPEGGEGDNLICQFRLLDDDDNVMFEGVCEDLNNEAEGSAFAPLDWGERDSGCTQMEFRYNNEDPWEPL